MRHKKSFQKETMVMGLIVFLLVSGFAASNLSGFLSAPAAHASSVSSEVPSSFSGLVKKASPSVVNINVEKVVKGTQQGPAPFGPQDPYKDFFDRFFGDRMPKEFKQRGLGTGFIIDKDGFILTNNHVVEDADEIKVKIEGETELPATIVGRDPKTDLALIKIASKSPLIPLPLGDSDQLDVGDWVVAIGNPFGLGNTVTAGIVSAKFRQLGAGAYDNFIQTDASINPGNSGGPLLNTMGEVIGINSAIFSQSGGSIGIGFAIPINMAKDLLPQLKAGKVIRGWLGVMIQNITPELADKLKLKDERGALVGDVTGGGPADKAGIKRGDVIVSFDGKEVEESNDLPYLVASTPVGKVATVEIIRAGEKKNIQVKIAELEEEKKSGQTGAAESQPELGMQVEQLTPEIARYFGLAEVSGVVVVEVAGSSPAADAGVQPGDIILEIDHTPVRELGQFNQMMSAYKTGDTILLLVKRQGATLFLTLKIGQ